MRDVIAGLALMVGGAAYGLTAINSLPLGTLRQMGPGMFPMGLGGLLFLLGRALGLDGDVEQVVEAEHGLKEDQHAEIGEVLKGEYLCHGARSFGYAA